MHGGAEDIPDVINTLTQNKVTTTFFTVGDWVKKYPDAIKKIGNSGMDLRKSFV